MPAGGEIFLQFDLVLSSFCLSHHIDTIGNIEFHIDIEANYVASYVSYMPMWCKETKQLFQIQLIKGGIAF